MNKKNFSEKLLLFSAISIPILTLLFATDKSPFEYTMSMIGNWFGLEERIEFILWGILTATALTFFLVEIYKKTKFQNKKGYYLLYLSVTFLILSVLTPMINQTPTPLELRKGLYLDLHALFAISFAIFLMLSIYTFTKYLIEKKKNLPIRPSKYLMGTAGGSILLLTIFGLTGVFEIFFFIAVSIFLIVLEKGIKD